MSRHQPPDGRWVWVPDEQPRKDDRPNRSSTAGTALFLVGVLLISQCLIGWRGVQAFQRLMNRYDTQIQQTEQAQ